jgi:hypothetical protein
MLRVQRMYIFYLLSARLIKVNTSCMLVIMLVQSNG